MAVLHNVRIPIGIAVAPTERAATFASFAEALIKYDVITQRELADLPLLSDEGRALAKYAHHYGHRLHFLCFRHLLEVLGSGTVIAMLAGRLLFTVTETAFIAILPQMLSAFAFGCRDGSVTKKAKLKFAEIFGLDLNEWQMDAAPPCDPAIFRAQALWGKRGTFGVGSCSNHLEGLHGRLNYRTRGLSKWLHRFAEIADVIQASAAGWSGKVKRARNLAKAHLIGLARDHGFEGEECTGYDRCDHGTLLTRRHGAPFPCIHLAAKHTWATPADAPEIVTAGVHEGIECKPATKIWRFKADRPPPRDAIALPEQTEIDVETIPHRRVLARVLSEMKLLSHGAPFRYSRDDMLYRLGRIHEKVDRTIGDAMSADERRIHANSEFFMLCVRVVKHRQPWPNESRVSFSFLIDTIYYR
jgi:hypothetical protein